MPLSFRSRQELRRRSKASPFCHRALITLAVLCLYFAWKQFRQHNERLVNNQNNLETQIETMSSPEINIVPEPHEFSGAPLVSNTIFDMASMEVAHSTIPAREQCLSAIRARHDSVFKNVFERGDWNDKALLVDPAYGTNVGDHMITQGELKFLKRHGFSSVTECHYMQANNFFPPCGETFVKSDGPKLALWHGGGNWGDTWPIAQTKRIPSFEHMLKEGFTVIGMPQSLFYKDNDTQIRDATLLKQSIAKGLGMAETELDQEPGLRKAKERVILTWREQFSIDKARELYPYCDHRLVPDIAFQLGPYAPIREQGEPAARDMVLLLRNDKESTGIEKRTDSYIQSLLDNVDKQEVTFRVVDWEDRLDLFHLSKQREDKEFLFTDSSIRLLSLGKVVIVDRLHAAILSYISGLSFVFVDQSTNKLTKTLKIAFESLDECQNATASQWARAESLEEAIEKAVAFL